MQGVIARNALKHEVSDVQLEKQIKLAVSLKARIDRLTELYDQVKGLIAETAKGQMAESGLKSWSHQGVFGLVEVRDTSDWRINPAVASVLRNQIPDRFTALVSQKVEYGVTPELRAFLKADGSALAVSLKEVIPYKEGITVSIKPRQD